MAYITTSQLSERLGPALYARLTDRVAGAVADESIAARLVADAEAEANTYLASRYATPVDVVAHPEVADVLMARVLDLAEYAAWWGSPFVTDPPTRVHALRATAVSWFQAVAAGRMDLPAARPLGAPTAVDDGPRFTAAPRTLTAEELDGL